MRILVIDKLFHNRSGRAEMDMYIAMNEVYELTFDISKLLTGEYDVLWLGAYHHRMGLDIHKILSINCKPVYVSQADNEEFASLPHYGDVTVLSRYLPNESLNKYKDVRLLQWYIEPLKPRQKTCDVAFICSQYGQREYIANVIRIVCERNGWTYIVGEYHDDYYELISKCRVMAIECSRECLTLKYLEASYSDCVIIGTIPKYPEFRRVCITT